MNVRSVWPALFLCGATAGGQVPPIVEAACRPVAGEPRRIAVTRPAATSAAPGTRLLVADAARPIGWADAVDRERLGAPASAPADADTMIFELAPPGNVPASEAALRGWLIAPDADATWLEHWPRHAELHAEVDALGPGGQSVWIGAGTNQGVRLGDSWWLRVGGQPAARCDVRMVAADLCFGPVEPLARTPALRPGSRVTLWPSPAERRRGEVITAVAFIEERGRDRLVWVAAPPTGDVPAEPHLDFFHEGRFVGHGRVERRDARFWYARIMPPASATPDRVGTDRGGTDRGGTGVSPVMDAEAPPRAVYTDPSSATDVSPAASSAPIAAAAASVVATARPAGTLHVGDVARVRTRSDLEQGRLVARVFEITPAGAVINAGEIDGVTVDQHFTVYRHDRPLGPAVVRRVQRSYAMVTPADALIDPPLVLHIGDELRLRPPPPPPRNVALVIDVVGDTLLTARLLDPETPLRRPLALREGPRTVGVVVLVHVAGGSAVGFTLPSAATAPLAAGQYLALDVP